MENTKLSNHFTLAEFCNWKKYPQNIPTIQQIANMAYGCRSLLEPAREQGFPLVVLLADGFPAESSPHERFYKPGGVYFEACSKGCLLLMEPKESAYEHPTVIKAVEDTLRKKAENRHYAYTAVPLDLKRYRFVALNEIGRLLVCR